MPIALVLAGSLLVSPATAQQQSAEDAAFVSGAELWVASDCAGDVPIVVGSDAKAQSDIYTAVTLAGIVGTDCVVWAGWHSQLLGPEQQRSLRCSVGRYDARAVSAAGDPVCWGTDYGGDPMEDQADQWSTGVTVVDIEVSGGSQTVVFEHLCLSNRYLGAFGWNREGQADLPHVRLAGVSLGSAHACGIEDDGSVVCWGASIGADHPL